MRAEETPDRGAPGHRPLPSVDMPLLREHRRATRVRKVVALALLLGALAAGGAWAVWFAPSTAPDAKAPATAAAPSPAFAPRKSTAPVDVEESKPDAGVATLQDAATPDPVSPGAVDRREVRFGTARGFRQALVRAGLDRDEVALLEQALDEVMDFRRCRPEDRMVFERDAGGVLVGFEYHGSATEFVRATRHEAGELRATLVQRPVEHVRIGRSGRIQSSLGDALVRVGLGRQLVGVFLSVFSGRVNFSTDARAGDTFRIIVDEKHLEGRFHEYGVVHALEYAGQRTGRLRAFYFEPSPGRGEFFDEQGRSFSGWLRTPCRFDRISSRYNPKRMHPILKRIVPHNGIDYAAGRGTPVWAAADGRVGFAGRKGANGNLVAIRHDRGYESLYAHLQRIEPGLSRGDQVQQGDVIGYVGSTGRSTGPHLHFAVKRGGRFVDPASELNGPGRMMPASAQSRYRQHVDRMRAELEALAAPEADSGATAVVRAAVPEADATDGPLD